MADTTNNAPPARQRRPQEYRLYFWLIFLLAIPFATVRWVVDVYRHQSLNLRGPLARAWQEADRITPMIFWA